MIAHVFPASQPLQGVVDPPSSKNFTTRYTLASCLANGRSIVRLPAVQDDAVALVHCCRAMGARVEALDASGRPIEFSLENDGRIDRLEIYGFGREPRLVTPGKALNPGNAGAVFRMLLAVSALLPEVRWETDYKDSLGKRPHRDLLDALEQLGVEVESTGSDGRLPITLRGGLERIRSYVARLRSERQIPADEPFPITVSGEVSSQYTSALLFLAPLLDLDLMIHVTGKLKSLPLIETTRNVLSRGGIEVESSRERNMHVVARGQGYAPRTWDTNGDWPGASAILAAAVAVPGSEIRVRRLFQDEQGEKECVPFYQKMGCEIRPEVEPGVSEVLLVRSPLEGLKGAAVNGDLCTDAVLAMMGAAMVAAGESRFVQIRVLQFKECDRVREPLAELAKVFATAPAGADSIPVEKALWFEPSDDPDTIHITGNPDGYEGGIDVDGRGDHRVIMMLSIVALRCRQGLRIHRAEHVSKSFPGWFDVLRQLGVRVEFSGSVEKH
jgi:3-phosphoshikimate 1-carboxyvinyltransferase